MKNTTFEQLVNTLQEQTCKLKKIVDAATVTAVCLLLMNIKEKMETNANPFEELPLNLSEFKSTVEHMLDSIDCCIGRKAQQEKTLKYSKPTVIH